MRLDLYLLKKKLAASRTQAQELIKTGNVFLKIAQQETILNKSSHLVSLEQQDFIFVKQNNLQKYVSRGGNKLQAAVQLLKIEIAGIFSSEW